MIVCIAEKPSVGREIAAVLGANRSQKGFMEGNGYAVTWTFGHLCTLKEPHDYVSYWKQWVLPDLPMIPARFGIKLIEDRGYQEQFAVIESLVKQAEMVVNCGDAGQEGELIQRWVLQKAGCSCPVKRLWISSLTEESIREGFQKLSEEANYQKLYEAGLARAIGDWLLGMNATRLYTLKYGRDKQVLSIGRVQTPTLALIVNRQLEIEQFIPETYWELKTLYREVQFNATQGRFNKLDEAEAQAKAIAEAPFEVTSVSKKKGREFPPSLFDLTSLQVECNKRYGMSAEHTLQYIQSLYEKKLCTYPRVDTTYLSDDIYPKLPAIIEGLSDYAPLTEPLKGKTLAKSKKVFDNKKVTDHHAIIPTGKRAERLSDEEAKVYDLVVRRFIGVFYPECTFSQTTVMGLVLDVEFKSTGKEILDQGWRVLWQKETNPEEDEEPKAEADEERTLPSFRKGEKGPHEPSVLEKVTSPPKYYSEATLLRAMETAGKLVKDEELREALKENGIGRPSTRAAIIETLQRRQYIRKERKSLRATETGISLIATIQNELLKSAELTGQWEYKLRQIERGEYQAKQFLDELKALLIDLVQEVKQSSARRL